MRPAQAVALCTRPVILGLGAVCQAGSAVTERVLAIDLRLCAIPGGCLAIPRSLGAIEGSLLACQGDSARSSCAAPVVGRVVVLLGNSIPSICVLVSQRGGVVPLCGVSVALAAFVISEAGCVVTSDSVLVATLAVEVAASGGLVASLPDPVSVAPSLVGLNSLSISSDARFVANPRRIVSQNACAVAILCGRARILTTCGGGEAVILI